MKKIPLILNLIIVLSFIGCGSSPVIKAKTFFTPKNTTDSNILKTCDSVEIELRDEEKKQIKISDSKSLASLLLLINGAESTDDHMCRSIATLKFFSGNSELLFYILPGHKDEFYEFRYGDSIYKINRAKFIEINEIKIIKEKLLSPDN